jgi:uncharacterized protein YebE (UPF0316 family)
MTMKAITKEYEQQLWKELNHLLADAVPEDASKDEGERTVMLAIMGHDTEIHALYEEVRRLARDRDGYLRGKLEENNPLSRARRRLYGKWACRAL